MALKIDDKINYLTVNKLKDILLERSPNNISAIDFFVFSEKHISKLKATGTKRTILSTIKSIQKFNGTTLPVSDINIPFINSYETFLHNTGVKNGINTYMRTFHTLFRKCQDHYNDEQNDNIIIPHDPFTKYKAPKPKVKSKEHYITVNELKALINYKSKIKTHNKSKDMFLLMFYLIGIESIDLYNLEKPIDGYITYIRAKTGKKYHFKVPPEAQKIIDKYAGKKKALYFYERTSQPQFQQTINLYLKNSKYTNRPGIFQNLKINKQVSTKWARHTWATIGRNDCNLSMDDISLSLGHSFSNNKVTDVYIKHDSKIIDRCNTIIIQHVTK